MHITLKPSRIFQLLFLLLLAFSILYSPARSCSYAGLALQLWFEKMIPSLFPFMVVSGLIVRLHFSKTLSRPVYPLIGKLYRINGTMCTTMLLGFLFGFPLGAKTIAEQYRFGQLTKPEAQYLLSFCNNIGPVYMLGFALPLLGVSGHPAKTSSGYPASSMLTGSRLFLPVLLLYFGIPLIYGFILRYTSYRRLSFSEKSAGKPFVMHTANQPNTPVSHLHAANQPDTPISHLHAANQTDRPEASMQNPGSNHVSAPSAYAGFIPALDDSVTSACAAITRLGGYMVFFMVCNMIPETMFQIAANSANILQKIPVLRYFCHFYGHGSAIFSALIAIILEITSGLSLAKDILPLPLLLTMLTFGGASCFAQTYTCIRGTDLSFRNYCLHKLFQTLIAFCIYTLLFSAFYRQ